MSALADFFLGVRDSFLVGAIAHIVALCSNQQVIGVEAGRIVAFMQDHNLGIEGHTGKGQPNHAVNSNHGSLKVNAPIPVAIFGLRPIPAGRVHA